MLIAGNWKMNGTGAELDAVREIARGVPAGVDAVLCVPATLIHRACEVASDFPIGGQDCHQSESGAHTGDISAEMLAEAGARYVIVGHSERRTDYAEDDATVRAKAVAARRAGLIRIVCVGETEAEREANRTLDVLSAQIDGSVPSDASASDLVVAYEPVWAIGSGKVASVEDVAEAHAHIREQLRSMLGEAGAAVEILYGGSVKPGNAADLMSVENVDGALVGGASLKASDFLAICAAAAS